MTPSTNLIENTNINDLLNIKDDTEPSWLYNMTNVSQKFLFIKYYIQE